MGRPQPLVYGKVFDRQRYFLGGNIKPVRLPSDIISETASQVTHLNGVTNLKPLQPLFGQTIKGLNIRANNNVIKPFSSQIKASRIPLSAESVNPENSPAVAHLGKAVGSAKSVVKNISGIFGRGVESKNNIRLVL